MVRDEWRATEKPSKTLIIFALLASKRLDIKCRQENGIFKSLQSKQKNIGSAQ